MNPRPDRPARQHVFKLVNNPTAPPVQLPRQAWDGRGLTDESDGIPTEDMFTVVNVRTVCDILEGVWAEVLAVQAQGHLVLAITENEMNLRYRFVISKG